MFISQTLKLDKNANVKCSCVCVCAVFPRHVVGIERRTEHGGPCGHQAGQREVDTTVGNLKSTGEIEKGHLGVSGTEMVMLAVIVRTVIFVHTYRLLFHLLLSYLLLFQSTALSSTALSVYCSCHLLLFQRFTY